MKGNGHDLHELIRVEAFLLSEKAGHPSHMHDYFWSQAEAIVRQRAVIVDIAVKAAGEDKPAKKGKPTKPTTKPAPNAAPAVAKKPAATKAKKAPEAELPLGEAANAPKPKAAAPKATVAKAAPKKAKTAPKPK